MKEVLVVSKEDLSEVALYVDGVRKSIISEDISEVITALGIDFVFVRLNKDHLPLKEEFPYYFDQESIKNLVAVYVEKTKIKDLEEQIANIENKIGPRFWFNSNCEYYIFAVKPSLLGALNSMFEDIETWESVSHKEFNWDILPT